MSKVKNKHGVLLINLGSPEAPTVTAVRRYLREFLTDPWVVDLPAVVRYPLVYGLIAPLRPFQTVRAYKQIWHSEGSPLVVYSKQLQEKLQHELGDQFRVTLGMRYGKPSIKTALHQLIKHGCDTLHILPQFPQYSAAATGSAIAKTFYELSQYHTIPQVVCHHEFHDDPHYIEALAHIIEAHKTQNSEFYLFSYHGVPERHIQKSEHSAPCDRRAPCPKPIDGYRFCYRAQCYETARLLANTLGIDENQYAVSFQSRLGRTPWIQPYTDHMLPDLHQRGIRHLTVVCPSFTADCLETLEEIGIRAKDQWQALGGQTLQLVPCLNDHPVWVDGLKAMIKNDVSK